VSPICFYHSADLNGKCSAAIVYHAVPNVELYGKELPFKPEARR